MDFSEGFVALPRHPALHERRSARHRPDAVLPAAVAGDAVLIRRDTAAVWVGALRAYPNGFEFTLRALRRDPPPREGAEWRVRDPFGSGLRLALEYADGRSAAVGRQGPPGPDAVELTQSIAGGTDFAWDADFWVSPLPPEGPVTFVAGWPDAGVPGERRAEFDGAALRAAAARCVQVWPEESYLPTGRVTWGTAHAADAELPASGPQEDGGPAAP